MYVFYIYYNTMEYSHFNVRRTAVKLLKSRIAKLSSCICWFEFTETLTYTADTMSFSVRAVYTYACTLTFTLLSGSAVTYLLINV